MGTAAYARPPSAINSDDETADFHVGAGGHGRHASRTGL
jgi:hypothetical protein